MNSRPNIEAIQSEYGVNPESIGLRHRGWWIVDDVDIEEEQAGAQLGDLCVKARDGASNPLDTDALKAGRFVGTSQSAFDTTYRFYFFRKLNV